MITSYAEIKIDGIEYPRYGVTDIDPDQFARRSHCNGNIIQSADGKTHSDFEVARTDTDGDVITLKRQGERRQQWSTTDDFAVEQDSG
jgi:hypothetical protein